MPLLSLGGMRFQQSWNELAPQQITDHSQEQLEATLLKAWKSGFHHVETARHYGSSEMQLGWALKNLPHRNRILQTKVPPREDPKQFEAELRLSFKRLGCEKLDLLAIHGLNLPEHLEQTVKSGGCLEVVRRWQDQGLIRYVGFSTHGSSELIVQAIQTDQFDFVNLHWYFIWQDNDSALDAAAEHDLGVFIISPTDKGGHLHSPSKNLVDLCEPFHPIVFNDLFCLKDQRVHTISVGAATPKDLDLHLQAISLLDQANEIVPTIQSNLYNAALNSLGKIWWDTWHVGLPSWQETPGGINLPILLWLHNLIEAWGMEGYAKARYSLLGNASHWFPGNNADCLDKDVSEEDLVQVLMHSPWCYEIPQLLRRLKNQVGGDVQQRLSSI